MTFDLSYLKKLHVEMSGSLLELVRHMNCKEQRGSTATLAELSSKDAAPAFLLSMLTQTTREAVELNGIRDTLYAQLQTLEMIIHNLELQQQQLKARP